MQSHMDTDPHAQQDTEQDTPVHRLDNTMRNAYVRQIQVGDICMGYDFLPKNTTTHACSTVSINTLRLFSATGGGGAPPGPWLDAGGLGGVGRLRGEERYFKGAERRSV